MSLNNNEFRDYQTGDELSARRASLLSLIILVVVIFILQLIMREIIKALAPQGNFLKLAVIGHNFFATFLPVCLFVVILKLPVRLSLGLHPLPWKRTLIAVISGLILIFAINLVLPLIIKPSRELVESSASIVAYSNLPEFLLAFLTISIFASIADEVFFRGILLRGLMFRYGSIIAILVTAILTALFHTLEPFKLMHAFLMGVIFATSVVWTKSVYTSVILHGLHNALSLIPLA